MECGNYRAFTVLNVAYKVLSQIIFCRLSPIANEFVGSYQAGFINRFQIIQKCRKDQVQHITCMEVFPEKLRRLIRATIDGVQNSVKISGEYSSSFESRRGR